MAKTYVHPDGAVAYPTDAADEGALRMLGFVEQGLPSAADLDAVEAEKEVAKPRKKKTP